MEKIQRFLHWLRYAASNVKAIETALIASAMWWAFILMVPLETFDSSTSYDAMANIASEEVWSAVFFVVAVLNIYGMIFERKIVRQIALVLSNGLWVFVSAMFAISNLATTGTGIYFIVACLNAFVVYKVGEQNGR
jgi:hypothetical protein